jgi:hypothetical protein
MFEAVKSKLLFSHIRSMYISDIINVDPSSLEYFNILSKYASSVIEGGDFA